MIVNGRMIAAQMLKELKNQVSHMEIAPHLTIFTCAPKFETQKYLDLKKQKAGEVGIQVNVVEFDKSVSTEEIIQSIKVAGMQTNGIVVQLPLPNQIDTDAVLQSIPLSYDVDGVHYDGTESTTLSPVTAAIKKISEIHDVLWAAQKVTVVGKGRLVGAPTSLWAQKQGAQVTVITKDTDSEEANACIKEADILVLGVGSPGMIAVNMIKEGAIIFDAGTSEEGGELVGDADVGCREVASLMTPVPGGIGPITVACLLSNLLKLTKI